LQCPKCRIQNPQENKFCRDCGAKLVASCPDCGSKVLSDDKFCGKCGCRLDLKTTPKEPASTSDISRLQRYLPEGLAQKILSQKDRIQGEMRQVTVLFCDMEGFTTIAEKIGPEAVYALMDKVYEILIHAVNAYEGTVNELTGDGIMALFGAPIALEDAPQRAVRAAIAMHKEITRFSERMTQEKGFFPIRMRIGINSGPVVVGTVGNNLRVEFKALGDTVNLASRLQNLAAPGTTLVTEETFKLTEGFFRFENLGEKQVKGKSEAVRVYQVLAPSSRRTRFDVSAERGLTPFLGRNRELELLLVGLARAKEGIGQIFQVCGEAGIGKSRFLYEFRKAVSGGNLIFLEGRCLSFAGGAPFYPIADLLKGLFEVQENDSGATIREKVKNALGLRKAEEGQMLPYLLELLGVQDSGLEQIALSHEGRKDAMINAICQTLLRGDGTQTIVIALEDLHWADPSTLEALRRIFDDMVNATVLIVLTCRPDFFHNWGSRSYFNQITLNRLSNREVQLMASQLLAAESVDPELQKLVFGKSEGVPFFVEELIKSLFSMGLIEKLDSKVSLSGDRRFLDIPSTIQDIIMARVDRLDEDARRVLKVASAIEREFTLDLINAVTGFPEDLLAISLAALKEAELLYERVAPSSVFFVFQHALTRDVVYASILSNERKKLHRRIGNTLAQKSGDERLGPYAVIAGHFFECEAFAEAAKYFQRAARAEKNTSIPDAIAHTRKRVDCLTRSPANAREMIDARTALALYLIQINHWVEAMEAIEPIEHAAREEKYWKRLGQIRNVRGCYVGFVEEKWSKAIKTLAEALDIAAGQQDNITLSLANMWGGVFQHYNCNFNQAESSFNRALDINVAVQSAWGIAAMKAQMAYFCHFYTAKVGALIENATEALKLATESDEPISMGIAHTTFGAALFARYRLTEAMDHLIAGKALLERVGLYGWASIAQLILAETCFEHGQYHQSMAYYEQIGRYLQQGRCIPSMMRMADLGVARCKVRLGSRDIDFLHLKAVQQKNQLRVYEGWHYRIIGEILVNMGGHHVPEAQFWIRKGIEADERNGTKFHLAAGHVLLSRFHNIQANSDRTRTQLGTAIEIMRSCGAEGWAVKYEQDLELHGSCG
jgi:class 3 adenylate cyclase/tetratricopeptide (TPR) repeat protein